VEIAIQLLAVLGLVLLNGFFVATEFSLVSVRRTRIETLAAEGNRRAQTVFNAIKDLDGYIAATQLGITMASIGLGWIGEPALARLLDPLFEAVMPETFALISAHTISFIIAFSAITLLHVVFGELAPKSLALQFPETVAMLVTTPTRIFLTIFRPIIAAMNGLGRGFLRLFGVQPAAGDHSLVYSEEELRLIVSASRLGGELEETEEAIIRRAFTLHDYAADEVMIPRTELIALPADASLDRVRTIISTYRFSRFPVYGQDLDDILGVLHVKDLPVLTPWPPAQRFDLRALMRPVLTVPTAVPIDHLLNLMKQRRTHVAIVIDEYGGTAGMITLGDIIERVVGDVPDEFEQAGPDVVAEPDGSAVVNGLTPLSEVDAWFGLSLPEQESHTIGGYIFSLLGRRPRMGDTVQIGPYQVRVEALDGLRISSLRFIPVERVTGDSAEPGS
jgi:CBS domain containing-hemolysin-like protein